MESGNALSATMPLLLVLILTPFSHSTAESVNRRDGVFFCESWKFSVETNNAGTWNTIPRRCVEFVRDYMNGERYRSDLKTVADDSLAFARTVKVGSDGKDAWVFDIDETLLSNLPYYRVHGFGSEPFDETSFDRWAEGASAPPIRSSLGLYRELRRMGFRIFLLTGRDESQRSATVKNLAFAGYGGWDGLILRGQADRGLPATVYKSIKRIMIESQGYRIQGCSGDQWSDQLGYAIASRSFKLPNPMYYIA